MEFSFWAKLEIATRNSSENSFKIWPTARCGYQPSQKPIYTSYSKLYAIRVELHPPKSHIERFVQERANYVIYVRTKFDVTTCNTNRSFGRTKRMLSSPTATTEVIERALKFARLFMKIVDVITKERKLIKLFYQLVSSSLFVSSLLFFRFFSSHVDSSKGKVSTSRRRKNTINSCGNVKRAIFHFLIFTSHTSSNCQHSSPRTRLSLRVADLPPLFVFFSSLAIYCCRTLVRVYSYRHIVFCSFNLVSFFSFCPPRCRV